MLSVTDIKLQLDNSEDTQIGSCQINGVPHHITAIPITGIGTKQRSPDMTRLQRLRDFEDVADGFLGVKIGRRKYAIVITPFCD